MANWKKMAEAFGRAYQQHGFKGKTGGTGSEVLDRAEYTAMGDDDLNKAFKQGRKNESDIENDTYRRFEKNYDGSQTGEDLGRVYDKVLDETSDKRLESEFDKGFEDAIGRRKGKSGINRSYLESRGLSPEEIDQIDTDENRRILIDLLKKNPDTGDVLRNF